MNGWIWLLAAFIAGVFLSATVKGFVSKAKGAL